VATPTRDDQVFCDLFLRPLEIWVILARLEDEPFLDDVQGLAAHILHVRAFDQRGRVVVADYGLDFGMSEFDRSLDADVPAHRRVIEVVIFWVREKNGDEVEAQFGNLVFELLIFLGINRLALLTLPPPDTFDWNVDE